METDQAKNVTDELMGETRLTKSSRICIIVAVALSVLVTIVAAGGLDRFADDGDVNTTPLITATLVLWIGFSVVVWVFPRLIEFPRTSLLFFVATALALGVAEITARFFVPGADSLELHGVSSETLHHIYPPQTRMYHGRFEGEDVYVITNSDGLRSSYEKDEFNTFNERVVVLGDSFTFGFGVPAEKAFPHLLESELRQNIEPTDVAVLNAGIISYSPFLEKLLFDQRIREYHPTLVLLFLDATDIGDDYRYMNESAQEDGTTVFQSLPQDREPQKYRGALYGLVSPYISSVLSPAFEWSVSLLQRVMGDRAIIVSRDEEPTYEYYRFQVSIGDAVEYDRFFIYRHPLDETEAFFDRTMKNIDEIARLAREGGAQFALFVTPRFHHWNVRESPDNWEKNRYRLDEPFQFEYFRYFELAAQSRDYPIISLLPEFQATDEFPLVFRGDPHWNAAGHSFVANQVLKHVLEQGLITSVE